MDTVTTTNASVDEPIQKNKALSCSRGANSTQAGCTLRCYINEVVQLRENVQPLRVNLHSSSNRPIWTQSGHAAQPIQYMLSVPSKPSRTCLAPMSLIPNFTLLLLPACNKFSAASLLVSCTRSWRLLRKT